MSAVMSAPSVLAHQAALRKSERLLDRTGRLAGVGGWEIDLASAEIFLSDQTCRIYGRALGWSPTLTEALDFFPLAARITLQAALDHALRYGAGWELELPFMQADGQSIWVRSLGTVEMEHGQPIRLIGALQDVTAQYLLAAELAKQHELVRVTVQTITDAIISTDASGCISWLNPVAERMTGWHDADARGRPLDDVLHLRHDSVAAPVQHTSGNLPSGRRHALSGNTVLISRAGHQFGIEETTAPINDQHGALLGSVLVLHDVTEQRRLAQELYYRATHDALTGLINRAEFDTRLRHLLHQTKNDGSNHALLYIDLDQFKLVNDACGHTVGDKLLRQTSLLLREAVRPNDTLARLGGDEFAVILEHCSAEHAQQIAQKMCDRMEESRFLHDTRRFRIGASIGLVPIDTRWGSIETLLQAADTSCYAAKEAGRNRVHLWFDTDLKMHARHNEMQWATRVEQALDDDRFVLYAQRLEALNAQPQGVHAEVLVRMIDTDGSLIAPGAFLPAAERFHLASRMDRWVLQHAIDWLLALPYLAPLEVLCVNLSGQSLGDRAFHRHAIHTLNEAGAEVCRLLCFEITETAAITNMADAVIFIEQVRTLGVRIALDDFGAGASSFGYLKKLKVDYLKIDGQFIKNLVEDKLDDAAVRCFVDVAKVVGIKTVAEFVDRPAVLERLRELGVDYAQGFLLHRPAPIAALFDAIS